MDQKTFDSLIDVLQKHEDAIRRLQIANTALILLAREEAIKTGESAQTFEKRFHELRAIVEGHAPELPSDIAKEIQENIAEINQLERLRKMKPN